MLRTVVATSLAHAGHTVLQAADGLRGVELARLAPVDLVISDLIMPVQEGVETIMTLRREHPNLPVIAISGGLSNSPLYLSIAGKIGADRVLPKPFTSQELLQVIGEVMTERREIRPAPISPSPSS